jgi:S-adenosylmethionine:tRNA ribosyltransferase-isomerase
VALWKCFVGNAKRWKITQLVTDGIFEGKPIQLFAKQVLSQQDYFIIQFEWQPADLSFDEILGVLGFLPLPPYMNRAATDEDKLRYQTIYARFDGSVAAPTAGLHFTDRVLDGLAKKEIHIEFVTLHVGAGTFKPVKSDTMAGYAMHDERVIVSKQTIQQLLSYTESITAVGTTSLRTLESLYWLGVKLSLNKNLKQEELLIEQWYPYQFLNHENLSLPLHPLTSVLDYLERNGLDHLAFRTFIIIVPGYSFQMVRRLITNFHQPESTLILLVAAFIGENWRKVYQYALDHQYRFLSYGDSSLLFRNETTE